MKIFNIRSFFLIFTGLTSCHRCVNAVGVIKVNKFKIKTVFA